MRWPRSSRSSGSPASSVTWADARPPRACRRDGRACAEDMRVRARKRGAHVRALVCRSSAARLLCVLHVQDGATRGRCAMGAAVGAWARVPCWDPGPVASRGFAWVALVCAGSREWRWCGVGLTGGVVRWGCLLAPCERGLPHVRGIRGGCAAVVWLGFGCVSAGVRRLLGVVVENGPSA